jgi:sugar phosphate permease
VLGFTSLRTGLAFLPFALATVLGAPLASRLTGYAGARVVAPTGLAAIAGAMLLLSRAPPDGSYAADVLPASLLAGLGAPLAYVPVTLASVAGVHPRERGLASGLYNTSAQLGGALVVALVAVVAAWGGKGGSEALSAGLQAAHLVGAGLLAVAALAVGTLLRGPRPERRAG